VIQVSKYLERVADHATNIAEGVIFVVRGDDVRHSRVPVCTGVRPGSGQRTPAR
jgi:phosphate uptake regulator